LVEDRLLELEANLGHSHTPSTQDSRTERNTHYHHNIIAENASQPSLHEDTNVHARGLHDHFPSADPHVVRAAPTALSATHPNGTGTPSSSCNVTDSTMSAFDFHMSPQISLSNPPTATRSDDLLSDSVCAELCTIWFLKYHPWFPILHPPSWGHILLLTQPVHLSKRWIVVQAIMAVTLQQSTILTALPKQRREMQSQLESEIITGAMSRPTIESLQALLILSNLSYGGGKIFQSWSLFALCRR
jgi:hypothetical protein